MNDDKHRFDFARTNLVKSIIFSGGVLIILTFIILRYQGFFSACRVVADVLRPLLIGLVLAFLLNRPFLRLERWLLRVTKRCRKNHQPAEKLSYVLALVLTYLAAGVFVAGLVCIIIPRVSESVILFTENLGGYLDNLDALFQRLRSNENFSFLQNSNVEAEIEKKLRGLADYLPEMLQTTYNLTAGLISGVIDFVMGVMFSIYILADKRRLKRQAQGLCRLGLRSHYPRFAQGMNLAVTTFSDFATGQCMEAVFIAMFCFIGMRIFGFDYAALISVMVGVTNVIPIVGPFIGTIPSAFLLLLVEPRQAFWFVVFIIVLQQLESNLLYPRVVGKSVGLPPLWVLAAVVIGGGLGGVWGMVIGVPVCSILYVFLNRRLDAADAAA